MSKGLKPPCLLLDLSQSRCSRCSSCMTGRTIFLTLLLYLLLSPGAFSQGKPVVTSAEAEKWRADLRHMAEEMPKYHKNLFHSITPSQFDAAVKKLDEKIPTLARHQIIVELARIVAMIGDGHTNINPTRDPKIGFSSLPIKLYLFKDGLFIRSAMREQSDLVGARVTKIGGLPTEEAIARAAEIIGKDNDMDVKFFAPHLLVMPEVLNALGLSSSAKGAELAIQKGRRHRVVSLLASGPADLLPPDTDLTWLPKEGWVDMRDGATSPVPRWLRDPKNKFWYEDLPDSRTMYVQINEVGNKEHESLEDFTRQLFNQVETSNADRLVFDVRLNRGGNGELLNPLVRAVIKSDLNRRGKLFAIIGRSSWSAAQFFLNDLEKYTDVTFVGEPSGSRGNTYGDSRRITLPNSGITARVSVYYWQDWHPMDTRKWTAPDLTAELSAADYAANADPALKVVLAGKVPPDLDELLDDALERGGVELAVKKYREFRAAPLNKFAATMETLLVTGQRLLDQKQPKEALELFKLVVEENPDSFRGYFATGVAYVRVGNKEMAIARFKRALELSPNNYDVSMQLKALMGS